MWESILTVAKQLVDPVSRVKVELRQLCFKEQSHAVVPGFAGGSTAPGFVTSSTSAGRLDFCDTAIRSCSGSSVIHDGDEISKMSTNDSILALHGFCGDRLVMYPLCRKLRQRGYKVTNYGYRSIWKTIEHHAAKLRKAAEAIEANPEVVKFHLVGHSMGSILIRVMLQEYQPEKLGRIVMIGPPNRGSHVATRFASVFGWLSTTLCQIKDTEDSFVNSLEQQIDPDHELGIIQAETDLVVRPENTRLPGAREYIMLPGFHSSVLVRESCAMQVDHFLQHGSFAEQVAGV